MNHARNLIMVYSKEVSEAIYLHPKLLDSENRVSRQRRQAKSLASGPSIRASLRVPSCDALGADELTLRAK